MKESRARAEELRALLESEAMTAEVARDAAEGLARLAAGGADLVIADVALSAMSGYELCRAIKSSLDSRHVPVMLLASAPDPTVVVQALECGADSVLAKPIPREQLVCRARDLLESKRMRAARTPDSGLDVRFLGRDHTITSPREQVLDLLMATFAELARKDRELSESQLALAAANRTIEDQARSRRGQAPPSGDPRRTPVSQPGDAIFIENEHGGTSPLSTQPETLLAAGLAHEMDNPTAVLLSRLGVVSAYVEHALGRLDRLGALAEHAPGPLREQLVRLWDEARLDLVANHLGQIVRDGLAAGERIRDLVRRLESFSRLDDRDMVPVHVHDRLDNALRLVHSEVRLRARIEKRYAPALPAVHASPGRLDLLFSNLLLNAAHALDERDAAQNLIAVDTYLQGTYVRVDIADTGKGIPESLLPKIFEPFFTTRPDSAGMGLGLPICRDIVKKHRGEMHVRSQVGRGTTFSVLLPAHSDIAPRSASSPPRSSHVRRKVLLIEDDKALVSLYARKLNPHHDLTVAPGGREALAILAAGEPRFDVILCDIMMPDVDGVEVHQFVVERWPDLASRMIFLTGGAFTTRASDFLDRVPNPRLEKPFTMDALLRAVAELTEKN